MEGHPVAGRTRTVAAACAAVVATASVACSLPRDPEGTLERVTDGTIRVGVSASDPWVVLGSGGPGGIEVELVERFATDLGAEVEWVEGSVDELAAALHVRELDLVVAGLASTSPISSEAALTHPYVTTQVVVAAPPGVALDDVAGVEVGVEDGSEAAGILAKTDAVPVRVDDVATFDGPVAVDSYLVDDLRLRDTGLRLAEVDHVMAVPHGENAWLVRLERFLLDDAGFVDRVIEDNDGG
ncbi:MAG TPA: transporter substrate-binding domain-containing protein [Actinomycetota bacterium]|nr:transporter substrate-binding domain-containing protein [Actinomycetota bacterium]